MCPHDDLGLRPRTGTMEMSEDGVSARNIESPYGGGVRSLPGAAGNCFPVRCSPVPVPSAEGPQLDYWWVAVVRVEETLIGDVSGAKFPRAETDRQPPIDLSDVAGNVRPALLAGGSPRAGVVNSVGPVRLPPHAEKTREPLEHTVLTQTDPAGQSADVGTLSPSDCYPVGPVGSYVTGGPAGPDVYITDLNSWTHMIRMPPDPDGQDVAANGTPSPSDCYPAGPVGPCVAGSPVGPYDYLPTLESSEHPVLEYADPAGQHDADLDTAESLEYTVVENILDGRPMEGVTWPELLEYSLRLLDATLDGGLVERISEWEPLMNPAISYTLDSRPMEETTNLERSALWVSLDSRPTEGAPCLEPLEQLVFSSSLAVRPVEGITKKVWERVINPVISYTLDSQLMEGITYHERLARGVSLDGGGAVSRATGAVGS